MIHLILEKQYSNKIGLSFQKLEEKLAQAIESSKREESQNGNQKVTLTQDLEIQSKFPYD